MVKRTRYQGTQGSETGSSATVTPSLVRRENGSKEEQRVGGGRMQVDGFGKRDSSTKTATGNVVVGSGNVIVKK
jgi:hypothetical protein